MFRVARAALGSHEGPPVMSGSNSNDDPPRVRERRVWVPPLLTIHESLSALTQQLPPHAQPYLRGDSLVIGDQIIPCSQGFCP
jgi:hypothetical protein